MALIRKVRGHEPVIGENTFLAETAVILGDVTIAENREEGSFIWENFFDEETGINEYELTLFLPEENGLFRKYEEVHRQRAYGLDTVKELLVQAGLEFVAAYDAFTREPPGPKSQRVYLVARECQKKNGGFQ